MTEPSSLYYSQERVLSSHSLEKPSSSFKSDLAQNQKLVEVITASNSKLTSRESFRLIEIPETAEGNSYPSPLSLEELEETKKTFHKLEKEIEDSSSIQATISAIKLWVSDFVMKGGSSIIASSVPFFLHTPSESIKGLNPIIENIIVGSDVLDMGTEITKLIYKSRFITAAEEELIKLNSNSHALTSDQLIRLEQLEKLIKYERSLHPLETLEQGFKSIKNLFYYTTYALSWVKKNPLVIALSHGAEALLAGSSAALYGLFFFQAREAEHTFSEWSTDFRNWIRRNTLFIDKSNTSSTQIIKEMEEIANLLKAKRIERYEKQGEEIQKLKSRLAKEEIKIEMIHSRINFFKLTGLQSFIKTLKIQEMSAEEFHNELEKKLGISLHSTLTEEIYSSSLSLSQQKDVASIDNEPLIKQKREIIVKGLSECCDLWIKNQSEETLLAMYIDYQAVLDPLIKNSLTEMVEKKHQLEGKLLKFEKTQAGIHFSIATLIFGVTLTLSILALLGTPFGGASLILALLITASSISSYGMLGAGYYLAYHQNPGLTSASLRGIYIRLFIYSQLNQIASFKDKIKKFSQQAWETKRNQYAHYIQHLPLIRHFFSPQKETISQPNSQAIKEKIELDFKESQVKAQTWKEKADALQEEIENITWKDFAKQAHLKVANESKGSSQDLQEDPFDTLKAWSQALIHADFNLLNVETKELIEKQLGVNLKNLQVEIEKNPLAVEQMLRNFFNLNETDFIKFIIEQKLMQPPVG